MLTVFRHALMDAVATLARIFHQIAGWWRVNLRADLRIPCQANSHAYWREAGCKDAANWPPTPAKAGGTNWILD